MTGYICVYMLLHLYATKKCRLVNIPTNILIHFYTIFCEWNLHFSQRRTGGGDGISVATFTLPETNIAPKNWGFAIGNDRLPTIHFQGRLLLVSGSRVPGFSLPKKVVRPLLGEASPGQGAFSGEFVQSPSTHCIRALEQSGGARRGGWLSARELVLVQVREIFFRGCWPTLDV